LKDFLVVLGVTVWLAFLVAGAYCIFQDIFPSEINHDSKDRLLSGLPALVIASASLLYTMLNNRRIRALSRISENRKAALDAFEKYAAEPIREAIKTLEDLVAAVEAGADARDWKKRLGKIRKTVDINMHKIRRLCREADRYMSLQGHAATFDADALKISENENIDDLFILTLESVLQLKRKDQTFYSVIGKIYTGVSIKKAAMRSSLTDRALGIASKYPA
jgi:hypothetical protein